MIHLDLQTALTICFAMVFLIAIVVFTMFRLIIAEAALMKIRVRLRGAYRQQPNSFSLIRDLKAIIGDKEPMT